MSSCHLAPADPDPPAELANVSIRRAAVGPSPGRILRLSVAFSLRDQLHRLGEQPYPVRPQRLAAVPLDVVQRIAGRRGVQRERLLPDDSTRIQRPRYPVDRDPHLPLAVIQLPERRSRPPVLGRFATVQVDRPEPGDGEYLLPQDVRPGQHPEVRVQPAERLEAGCVVEISEAMVGNRGSQLDRPCGRPGRRTEQPAGEDPNDSRCALPPVREPQPFREPRRDPLVRRRHEHHAAHLRQHRQAIRDLLREVATPEHYDPQDAPACVHIWPTRSTVPPPDSDPATATPFPTDPYSAS